MENVFDLSPGLCNPHARKGFLTWGKLMKKISSTFAIVLLFVTQTTFAQSAKSIKFDSNVEASLKTQMLADLNFMGSITSTHATPLHQQVFGKVDGSNYMKWLTSRVFSAGKDGCGNPNAVACVNPMYANKIWITTNYIKFSHPQIARLSVVYHEARHTETQHSNWSHATCPTPFLNDKGQDMRSIWTNALLQGEPACDITAFGSYGTQTILLKNIALNCANCNSKVKADADLYANDQLGRIVDAASKSAMKKDFQSRL